MRKFLVVLDDSRECLNAMRFAALRAAHVTDFVPMLADGLDSAVGPRGSRLSGGQKQRVAIARALVHKPSLVIADEPTASLDSQTAETVIDIMKALGKEIGTTFIVATHDYRMAQHCDTCINLLDGTISKEAVSWAS